MGTLHITKVYEVDRDNSSPVDIPKWKPSEGIPVQALTTSGSTARVEVTGNPKRVILQADANVCVQIGDVTVEATSSDHPLAAYADRAFAPGEDGNFYIAAIEV